MFPAITYSPTLVSRVVPSAQEGLTSEFEMGSGVTPTLWSPEKFSGIDADLQLIKKDW